MTRPDEIDPELLSARADVETAQAAYESASAGYYGARLEAAVAVRSNAERLEAGLAIARASWVLEWHRLHVASLRLDTLTIGPGR